MGEDERPRRVDNRVLLLRVELALEDRAGLPHLDDDRVKHHRGAVARVEAQLEVQHLGRRRQVERARRLSLLPAQQHHRLLGRLCHRSKVVMFTPRFPANVLPLGGPGEAARKAPRG